MNHHAHVRVSVFDVVSAVVEPDMPYFIHRGPLNLEHAKPHAECWCGPMKITLAEVEALKPDELEQRLAQHFMVH